MGHVLWVLFNWPNGIVVGNLLSSVMWGLPAFVHLHRKIDRNHKADQAKGIPT